jgi:hypothetical protein
VISSKIGSLACCSLFRAANHNNEKIASKIAYWQYIFYSAKESRWEILGTYSCFSEFTRTSSVISEVSNRSKWGGLGWLSKVDLLLF